jgi:uncharacterized membrane protein
MWVQTGAYHLGSLYWLIAVIVVFIIAVIALIVAGSALMRARTTRRPDVAYPRGSVGQPGVVGAGLQDQKPPESMRLLDERYAKGEISREEYLQRQTDLQSRL